MPETRVYVGTYTTNGGEGIYLYTLDRETGALRLTRTIIGVVNPSFLAMDAAHRFLYAVNEVDAYYGKPDGALSAFSVDSGDGNLHFLNQRPSMGSAPCHISLDKTDRVALIANYGGGSIATFRLDPDGKLGDCISHIRHHGSGPNLERQSAPHAHCILVDPDNRHALAVDLGLDRILAYELDPETGVLDPVAKISSHAKPGSGPRQMVFHPNGSWAYAVHELESLITAYAYDRGTGSLRELGSLPTLRIPMVNAPTPIPTRSKEGSKEENYPACVQVDPRGRYLYVSNRGQDSIACYGINERDGTLTFRDCVPTGGKFPRHFSLDPEGRFLIAANQKSDCLTVFRIDAESGLPVPTEYTTKVPAPVCVLMALI